MTTDVELNAFQEQLAGLESEISRLSLSDKSTEDYFRVFLEKTVALLGHGGGVWIRDTQANLSQVCQINLSAAGLEEGGPQFQLFVNAVKKVFELSGPVVLPAQGGSNVFDGGLGADGINNSQFSLLFVPVFLKEDIKAVFLLISPPDIDPRAVRGYLGFIQKLCGYASQFFLRQHIEHLESQVNQSDEIHHYISALHSSLDPKKTCFALANYTQEFLKVYRCMAGTYTPNGKFKLEAVSGVESVVVKSNFIQSITRIARQVCRNDKIFLADNPNKATQEEADQNDLLTQARFYMLQASTSIMGIFPIKWEGQVVGALIVEKGEEVPFDQKELKKIDWMLVEAGSAIANALNYRRLPLSFISRALAGLRDKLAQTSMVRRLVWSAVIAIICAVPFVIKLQTRVIGRAELVPVNARMAYAAQDGIIETVNIPGDRQVTEGQVLAALDTRLIDTELDRVISSINETQIQLNQARMSGQTVQEKFYNFRLQAYQAEKLKFLEQKKLFEIRSPVDGLVINRDSEIRQLDNKPVRRGEPVLEVVPDQADWQLKVFVPEREAGELLRAYDKLPDDETLNARVILNAYPEKTFSAPVLSLARRAHVDSAGQQDFRNVIEVYVAAPKELGSVIDPRKGLEGKVAVECGKRNLLYVATHEFVDFLRISLF